MSAARKLALLRLPARHASALALSVGCGLFHYVNSVAAQATEAPTAEEQQPTEAPPEAETQPVQAPTAPPVVQPSAPLQPEDEPPAEAADAGPSQTPPSAAPPTATSEKQPYSGAGSQNPSIGRSVHPQRELPRLSTSEFVTPDEHAQWPFHVPRESERAPSKALAPSFVPLAYYQFHHFPGDQPDGALGELGVIVGASSLGVLLGYLDGLFVAGVRGPNLSGFTLHGDSKFRVSLLSPSVDLKAVTDFDQNVFFTAAISATGLGITRCGTVPFFAQLRGPHIGGWLPLRVAGDTLGDARAEPFIDIGGSAMFGFYFF